MLTDSGPLVSLLDRGDDDHAVCMAASKRFAGPLVTSSAAFTEAMHILGRDLAWEGQERLLELAIRGGLEIAAIDDSALKRTRQLMERYRDLPMDFADATLVALAEQRGFKRIFTLDSDFRLYRLHGRRAFEIVP
jgi:uncharacterized protein